MPAMGGVETLRRLRLTRPELPVLLATGNVDASVEDALERDRHARVIPKPFSLGQIRTMIDETAVLRA